MSDDPPPSTEPPDPAAAAVIAEFQRLLATQLMNNPNNRLLMPFDPKVDEWGHQLEED